MLTIDFDAIKSKVSVSQVLSHYTDVPSHGRAKYRIPCPIHNGVRSNFSVNDDLGTWFCFTCHRGGDVVSLVAALEGCSNTQAAERLMTEHGVSAFADQFTRVVRKTHREMLGWKDGYTQSSVELPETVPLWSYRDFSKEAIDHFGLKLVPGKGFKQGVFIPMRLDDGTMVGYSIRHTEEFLEDYQKQYGKKGPKYYNAEGLKKLGIQFGLFEDAENIRKEGFTYAVEGQFDCVSLWDRGVRNVIAVMGSSLSQQQALVLMKYTSRLVLMFDGDEAGQKGMEQVSKRFGSMFSISTVVLPPGTDPATIDLRTIGVR